MPDLLIETDLFPKDADLKLLEWLRGHLQSQSFNCGEPREQDGFWGFDIKDQLLPVWLLVAPVADEGPTYAWGISVDAKPSALNPRAWFRKNEGKEVALRIMQAVIKACKAEPGIIGMEEGDDGEFKGPINLVVGPNRYSGDD